MLEEKHTAQYLYTVLQEILEIYEVPITSIYTCTSDNARNMIKLSELFKEDQDRYLSARSDEDDHENSNDLGDSWSDGEMDDENLSEEDDTPVGPLDEEGLLVLMRCIVHTLQLCVSDVLKNRMEQIIAKARTVVKALRTESMSNSLKTYNIKRPVIDNATRWNSTFLMLESLVSARRLCEDLAVSNKQFDLSKNQWEKIIECVAALRPLKVATVRFQNEQFLPGDFYGEWLLCRLAVGQLESNLAKNLHEAMKRREDMVLNNDALLAALYLDPRTNKENEGREKEERAIKCLSKLWIRLLQMEPAADVEANTLQDSQSTQATESLEEIDDLDEYLNSIEGCSSNIVQKEEIDVSKIQQILLEFRNTKRIQRRTDLLDYWEQRRTSDPELYTLAMIANAVPMTQVSVERLFSAMKFIYSDLRANLEPKLVDDILLIRCNGLFRKESKKNEPVNRKTKQESSANSVENATSSSFDDFTDTVGLE